MSSVRTRKLPAGWYPMDSVTTRMEIESIKSKMYNSNSIYKAAIVPHAGWYYSGSIITRCLINLIDNPELIVVVGGHLPPGYPVLYAPEDLFYTPLGKVKNSLEFIRNLTLSMESKKDFSSDNSVEIIIPFLKYFFPTASVVWLRVGSGDESINLGSLIFEISNKLQLETIVIGSTDLTHYGLNYDFYPKGSSSDALEWVKGTNDRRIINKMIDMDYSGVLVNAEINKAACSAGAASAAIRFAELKGSVKGNFIDYFTSYDITPSESFVGYAGICF